MGDQAEMKELMECFDAGDLAFDSLTAAAADGKLNVLDLPKALPVVRSAVTAAQGKEKIPGELQPMTPEKAALIAARVFQLVQKGQNAVEAVAKLKA